jgi:hypothetical protein
MIRAVLFYLVAVLILSLMMAKSSDAKVRHETAKGVVGNSRG